MRAVVGGTLAAVTPVALTPRSIGVRPPRIDIPSLAPGTLAWIFHKPWCRTFCGVFRSGARDTARGFCAVRAIVGILDRGQEAATSANGRTSPSQGRGDHHGFPPVGAD